MFILVRSWYRPKVYIIYSYYDSKTRKYHKFIAKYCYECEARVTITKAMAE